MATITMTITITADTAAEYTDFWNRCLARIAEGTVAGQTFTNLRVSGQPSLRRMLVDYTATGVK